MGIAVETARFNNTKTRPRPFAGCRPGQRRAKLSNRGPYADPSVPSDDRTYAVFNHLAGLSSLVLFGVPFVSAAAVVAMWLIGRKRSAFVDDHGAEAVNFQLSLLLYTLLAFILALVFTIVTLGIGGVIFVLAPVFGIAMVIVNLVACIRGAVFASGGKYYRYPMCVRFIER